MYEVWQRTFRFGIYSYEKDIEHAWTFDAGTLPLPQDSYETTGTGRAIRQLGVTPCLQAPTRRRQAVVSEQSGAPLFMSRAGTDAAVAETIGRILEHAGYRIILQQWSFANRSFIAQMQAALESGSRVVALLSVDYLQSDNCAAEWQSVLADDPLNKDGRLIVWRIGDCMPSGLLKAISFHDLFGVRDADALERVVLAAVGERSGERGASSTNGAPRTAGLPSGNVTFLIGDIDGSAAQWERSGRNAAGAAPLRCHRLERDPRALGLPFQIDRRCVSRGVSAHGDAVACDAQCALAAADFREVDRVNCRMAIHSGAADERDGGFRSAGLALAVCASALAKRSQS